MPLSKLSGTCHLSAVIKLLLGAVQLILSGGKAGRQPGVDEKVTNGPRWCPVAQEGPDNEVIPLFLQSSILQGGCGTTVILVIQWPPRAKKPAQKRGKFARWWWYEIKKPPTRSVLNLQSPKSDTSMSENRSGDNASELIAETDHLAEILVSINNSNASIATTFYNLDINNETDAGGDCGSSGDLTGDC
ncbi:hypothetical protein F5050DRAFT_1713160 [Lentinula boryana]|uniref:Uncharacterized protein n=1 Tax=Lentinula boryana TaxID=40481 RepID=A0ABQ8Q9K7_9AGAR|nr:hypothetical protein F5050DRAFT_1713160 [Lentinula boryana]